MNTKTGSTFFVPFAFKEHDKRAGLLIAIGIACWFVFNEEIRVGLSFPNVEKFMSVFPIITKSERVFGVGSYVHLLYKYWVLFFPAFFYVCFRSKDLVSTTKSVKHRVSRALFGFLLATGIAFSYPLERGGERISRLDVVMFQSPISSVVIAALVIYLLALLVAVVTLFCVYPKD